MIDLEYAISDHPSNHGLHFYNHYLQFDTFGMAPLIQSYLTNNSIWENQMQVNVIKSSNIL